MFWVLKYLDLIKIDWDTKLWSKSNTPDMYIYKAKYCIEVRFASFFSGGFTYYDSNESTGKETHALLCALHSFPTFFRVALLYYRHLRKTLYYFKVVKSTKLAFLKNC